MFSCVLGDLRGKAFFFLRAPAPSAVRLSSSSASSASSAVRLYLFNPDAGGLDYPRPLRGFRLQERPELLRRAADRLHPDPREALGDVRRPERAPYRRVELIDHGARRARGRDDA